MSGGSHNYIYSRLSSECEGEMHDAEMDDLIKDLCGVLHDLEWWQSGDYSEDQYRETVFEFKKKWFKNELIKLIDKTYEDFENAPGGESWCKVDGKEYHSDMGYAYEGIDMFVDVLKSRLEKETKMSKVYIEMICDEDVADELMSYSPDRVDIIMHDDNPDTIIEMGGERYREKEDT